MIQPIDFSAFQRGNSGIESILARGGSALSTILRDAMQVGRDRANRQASQEKDFLDVQRQTLNLDQRKAELQQQDFEDALQFGEGSRRFDVQSQQANEELFLRRQAGARDEMRLQDDLTSSRYDREVLKPQQLEVDKLRIQAEQARIAGVNDETAARREEVAAKVEDRKYEREVLRPKELELEGLKIQTEKERISGIKDERERGKAEADLALTRSSRVEKTLSDIDSLLAKGDEGSKAAASALFTSVIENPVYEASEGTRERLSRRLGLPANADRFSRSAPTEPIDVYREMPLEDLEAELVIREKAAKGTTSYRGSEDFNLETEQLRALIEARKKAKTGSKGTTTPENGGMSAADRFRLQGQQSRSAGQGPLKP